MQKQSALSIVLILVVFPCFGKMHILLTAALTDAYFEFRRQQYITNFTGLDNFGYHDFYIVEALKKHGPTFLDDYSNHVFYATTNNPNLRNKGINEAQTMLEAIGYFNFNPEDMILKMTGRYRFISDRFLKLVENSSDYDAIIKIHWPTAQAYTLGFAMKCKYLQEMLQNINYWVMEDQMINLEREVAKYVLRKKNKNKNFKVLYVENLDIEVNVFGSSVSTGAPNEAYVRC